MYIWYNICTIMVGSTSDCHFAHVVRAGGTNNVAEATGVTSLRNISV
jgi:hypothetical protein